jgi:hypothetical protein
VSNVKLVLDFSLGSNIKFILNNLLSRSLTTNEEIFEVLFKFIPKGVYKLLSVFDLFCDGLDKLSFPITRFEIWCECFDITDFIENVTLAY